MVDDQPLVRDTVTQLLEILGHRVVAVGSGAEALTRLEERFDLVLLDITLPDFTTQELISRLRCHFDGAIVLMSGFPHAATDSVEQEVAGFLPKPFGLDQLSALLDSI